MWIFSEKGMVSAVAHRDKVGVLLVRARRKEHLEAFLASNGTWTGEEIIQMPSADYEYRIEVSLETFGELLTAQGRAINYPNFKGRCDALPDKAYAQALHKIWTVVHNALARN